MQLFLSQPRYLCGYRLYGSPRAARQGYAALLAAWHSRRSHVHPGHGIGSAAGRPSRPHPSPGP